MKPYIKIFMLLTFLMALIINVPATAQKAAKTDAVKKDTKTMSCCGAETPSGSSAKITAETEPQTNTKINAAEFDKNKDGKVYQCPMHPDQIADIAGKCSKCGMSLKEVSVTDAQKALDKKSGGMTGGKMGGMKMMNKETMKPAAEKTDLKKDNIVREGEIDLAVIDKNGDKKVFQCPMDLNVISDAKEKCPECGMNLREISIDDAKAKLIKKGFKVK